MDSAHLPQGNAMSSAHLPHTHVNPVARRMDARASPQSPMSLWPTCKRPQRAWWKQWRHSINGTVFSEQTLTTQQLLTHLCRGVRWRRWAANANCLHPSNEGQQQTRTVCIHRMKVSSKRELFASIEWRSAANANCLHPSNEGQQQTRTVYIHQIKVSSNPNCLYPSNKETMNDHISYSGTSLTYTISQYASMCHVTSHSYVLLI